MHIDDRVTELPGVGSTVAERLQEAFGIVTLADLLEHYPRKYHDAGEVLDFADVEEGEPATLLGEVLDWSVRRTSAKGRRRPLDIARARVRQASGNVFTVTFFNQRWRPGQLHEGTVAAFSGTVKRFRSSLELSSPDVQLLGKVSAGLDPDAAAQRLEHQRLLAVYPAVEGLPSFRINELVAAALEALPEMPEWLPETWLHEQGLIGRDAALRSIHQPQEPDALHAARRRLVFDELLTLQLGLQSRRVQLEAAVAGRDNAVTDAGKAEAFLAALPFALTPAQTRALTEINGDLGRPRPMHRLLQGDVGSGKTVVALWAMLCAVDRGRQAALMVPTEVLADQHYHTLTELLAPLGVNVLDGVRVELLTSSTPASQRRRILAELMTGQADLVVGTHALLEEGVRFADLGVAVIDEQHRFGVSQRVQLKDKTAVSPAGTAPAMPDVLVMTATPIPRSLALTLYGDLDVTVLDELPPGREAITTQLITPDDEHRRDKLYAFVREEAAAGRRTYIVCPFVESSDAMPGRAAVDEHARLSRDVFPELEVELVHGRLRPSDKERAMARFRAGEAQVLVATTVIEVGVDIPQASLMVIEDAERFGISQLHQLRGRVGRGGDRSYCVLFAGWSAPLSDDARPRLDAVAATTDGFRLAETDLAIRGSGQLFGREQSGTPDLKLADLREDLDIVGSTRELARQVVAADPELRAHPTLRAELERRYEGGFEVFAALETG